MRCRLRDGFRLGTPIIISFKYQNFNLFSAFHAGDPCSGGPMLEVLDFPTDPLRKPLQFRWHKGCCGNSSRISSLTQGVKSTQSLTTATESSPWRGKWLVQGLSSRAYSKVLRQRTHSHLKARLSRP